MWLFLYFIIRVKSEALLNQIIWISNKFIMCEDRKVGFHAIFVSWNDSQYLQHLTNYSNSEQKQTQIN